MIEELEDVAGAIPRDLQNKTLRHLDIERRYEHRCAARTNFDDVIALTHLLAFFVQDDPILIQNARLPVHNSARLREFSAGQPRTAEMNAAGMTHDRWLDTFLVAQVVLRRWTTFEALHLVHNAACRAPIILVIVEVRTVRDATLPKLQTDRTTTSVPGPLNRGQVHVLHSFHSFLLQWIFPF